MNTPASRRGFSVRVFLPDGDPDGIKVIEKSNWSGSGLVLPRSLFAEAKVRPEFNRAGVYVLVGQGEGGPLPHVYVGEGDPVRPRIEQHAKQKDFWTHAVIFTSKDQNLNKAHVQRLEARLVELARISKRCVLENGNIPQPPSLSEPDTAEVDGFLDDMLLCLPTLGFSFFEAAPVIAAAETQLILRSKGIEARGFDSPKGFVVRTGSSAVNGQKETPSIHAYLKELRSELLRQGVLVNRGEHYALTQDYTFGSPSTAAGVLLGCAANGRTEWRTDDGTTLKALQEAAAGE